MFQIKPPDGMVISLLGNRNLTNSTATRFCKFVLDVPVDSGRLLFNNMTKEIIFLTTAEYKNLLADTCHEIKADLYSRCFIVEEDFDEFKICNQMRATLRIFGSERYLERYTILTTTACNARCFYCFEAGAKSLTMDDDTAVAVANYILRNRKEGKSIKIHWFGGEPLCNTRAIDVISQVLIDNGVEFHSSMTTNASLFNDSMLKKACDLWKLSRVSVTIDGLRDTYNKVKAYRGLRGDPFYIVLDNIRALLRRGISVHIRINMAPYNASEVIELIKYLRKEFKEYAGLTLYPALIYQNEGFDPLSYTNDDFEKLQDDFIKIVNEIDQPGLGYPRYLREFKAFSCQADDPHVALILPDGRLGFCEHNVDCDTFSSVYEDVEKPFWSEYVEPTVECRDCVAYPSCLRLKKCLSHKDLECYRYQRVMRTNTIRRTVLDYYEHYVTQNVRGEEL